MLETSEEICELAIHGILGGEAYAWTDGPGRSRHMVHGDLVLVRAASVPFAGQSRGTRRLEFGARGPATRPRSSAAPTPSTAT